jgi:CHAT domain-containing protein
LAITVFYAREPFGNWLFQKGIEAKKDWQTEKAINYFAWAEKISSDKINARFEKAVCLQLRGEFILSQTEFEKLLAESIINQHLQSQILNANGVNLFSQNLPDKALESHRESLKIARLISDKKLEAQILVNLARVLYHAKGKFDEAETHLENALKIGRELNDEPIIADSWRNLGVVFWWGKGELDRPLNEFYQPALELYRKIGDQRGEAMMLSNISLIYSFKGDFYEHLRLQNESLAIREKIGDQAGLSESYRSFGTAYSSVRNLSKAREFLLKSYELSKKIGFRLTQNEAETYLAGVSVEIGEYDEAINLFQKIYEREKDSPELAKNRLSSIGYCYLLKNEFEKAREIFGQILDSELKNERKDVRTLSAMYIFLGEVLMRLGEREKAKDVLQKAEELKAKHGGGMIQGLLSFAATQAEFAFAENDSAKAIHFLNEAAEDELNLFASNGTNVITHPLPRDYDRIFSLLLEKLNRPDLAFRFLEQRRYRALRNFIVQSGSKNTASMNAGEDEKRALENIQKLNEQLKNTQNPELRERLRKAYGEYENAAFKGQFSGEIQRAIADIRPIDLKSAQQNLDANTALIEYVFAAEKVFAIVVTRDSLQSFALPVSRANLKNKTQLLHSAIFEQKESDDWQPIAESLREILIEPLEKSDILRDKKRLAIVPVGFLHDLPFAALMNGEKRFLIEDYTIFYPPSATFLGKDFSLRERREFISFGINQSANQPPLKFAVEEAKAVAEIFGGKSNLENSATETKVKKSVSTANYLHFATHAVAESEMPLFSRLLLNSSEKDDGNLTVREIFELGIETELVTIAACEGAKSFSADAEGLIEIDRTGLTEAFLHAGSKSVLASLSPISDAASVEFMKDFYSNLKTKDKAEALAESQRKMLRENFKHPRFWSPFILVGTDK